jgi:hypothetical protein
MDASIKTTAEAGPSLDDVRSGLQRIHELLESAALEPGAGTACSHHLDSAVASLDAEDLDGLVAQVDLFVLTVGRLLGSELSLRRGFELVDVALLDVEGPVVDAGHLFAQARPFVERFTEVAAITGAPRDLPVRPNDPDGVRATQARMEDAIRSYALAADAEERLLASVRELGDLAAAALPANELRFIRAATSFNAELVALQGTYVTRAQVDFLLGLVFMAWPAALCFCPVAWLVQAIVVIGGISIYLVWRSGRGRRAGDKIIEWIKKHPNATKQEIIDEAKEETKDLSDDDKKNVAENLEKISATTIDSDQSQHYQEAANALK